MIAPESILPFRVDLRKARDAFAAWIKSRWFAPNALKKMANLGQLSGIYVPYWTYDAMTYTYSGRATTKGWRGRQAMSWLAEASAV